MSCEGYRTWFYGGWGPPVGAFKKSLLGLVRDSRGFCQRRGIAGVIARVPHGMVNVPGGELRRNWRAALKSLFGTRADSRGFSRRRDIPRNIARDPHVGCGRGAGKELGRTAWGYRTWFNGDVHARLGELWRNWKGEFAGTLMGWTRTVSGAAKELKGRP
jgi:hypothetical protein